MHRKSGRPGKNPSPRKSRWNDDASLGERFRKTKRNKRVLILCSNETGTRLGIVFFDRYFSPGFHHFIKDFSEFLQPGGRNDHVVPASVDILSDSQKASPRILLQGEDEGFSFDLNFLRFKGVLLDVRLWRP